MAIRRDDVVLALFAGAFIEGCSPALTSFDSGRGFGGPDGGGFDVGHAPKPDAGARDGAIWSSDAGDFDASRTDNGTTTPPATRFRGEVEIAHIRSRGRHSASSYARRTVNINRRSHAATSTDCRVRGAGRLHNQPPPQSRLRRPHGRPRLHAAHH